MDNTITFFITIERRPTVEETDLTEQETAVILLPDEHDDDCLPEQAEATPETYGERSYVERFRPEVRRG